MCLEDIKFKRSILDGGNNQVFSIWNTKSLMSNLMVPLCFERTEKGKATASKGTSAVMIGGEIHISNMMQ